MLHNYPKCKAFLPRREVGPLIQVEEANLLNDAQVDLSCQVQKSLGRNPGVYQNGDIPDHRGKPGGMGCPWQRHLGKARRIDLEKDRRLGQFVLVLPAGVKLSQPAHRCAVEEHAG